MTEAMVAIERFAPCVGQAFSIGDAPDGPALKLVEASPLTAHGNAVRAPFVLLFQSAHVPMLQQASYRLANPTAGTLDIFLVPVGRDAAGTLYEAVFN
ncbi:DUF6916 family protein [Sphingomonas qomolangmaensis]|uniref:DUF6916 domain-containing protein n=1 Tax=Sphingomonas qomolangmaensis TaxID=2918765 RepID=A0ABY5LA30_9SPHN|nr:hypothetical protein [Sphingomonas qomolangmaensis]UUL82458.1 hypothetical protein NMP03_15015 [Sphingomonas qomolangmaensis]